jgi:hypothetical protein
VSLVGSESGMRLPGRFWLPSATGKTVGGWLDLSAPWPVLELADPLTPPMREVSRVTLPDGSVSMRSEFNDDDMQLDGLTVHGMLRRAPHRVTVVGATTTGRSQVFGGVTQDSGDQRMHAEYVLLGGHQTGADAVFTQARLRLRHLDAWAQLPGVQVEVVEDGSRVTVVYEAQEPEIAPVPGLSGRLVLDSVIVAPRPTVQGASVTRRADLRLEVTNGLTLDALWRRFVSPLAVLLSLAVDTDCPPVALDIYSQSEERWLEVRRPELKNSAVDLLPVHKLLMTRTHLGIGHLAAWLDAAPGLRPIPSLVAQVAANPDRTLVNQLLEMAIAVEGLHRRLRPEDRVMSLRQADRARRLARDAVPPDLRERVNDALMHLEEPMYAERLSFIINMIRDAVPGATGKTMEWKRRIKAVRNGFAHQARPRVESDGAGDDDDGWREYFVLLRTLRWVLTGVLLLQTGLDSARLGERVGRHEPYRFLLRQAEQWLPNLYAASSPTGDVEDSSDISP